MTCLPAQTRCGGGFLGGRVTATAMRVVLLVALTVLAGCLTPEATQPSSEERSTPAVDNTVRAPDATLSRMGRWLAPFDAEVPAVNLVLLQDGRLLYWSGVEANHDDGPAQQTFFTTYPMSGESRILEFTPDGPVVTTPHNAMGDGDDLFCSGQTMLPDGRILTSGGTHWHDATADAALFLDGIKDARIFDPSTDTWTRVADMVMTRWYPSLFTAPDGTPMAASGIGNLANFQEHWANWESYDLSEDTWGILAGTDGHLLPLYPRLHVLPGGALEGQAFYSTAGTLWGPAGEHPMQAEWSYLKGYDIATDRWHEYDLSTFGARQYASSVLLPADPADGHRPTIVSFGGTLQQGFAATRLTEIIDASTDPPTSMAGPDMIHARWHHNSVLLPTGEVVTIGGGMYDNVVAHGQENQPVLPAEMYAPDTGTWTELAAMTVPRMYHSTAILLPDARILAAGHVPLPNPDQSLRDSVNPQVAETRMEIYEPGYLFRGERPIILSAPVRADYGQLLELEVDHAGAIDSVMLMRPGTTTHAFDSGQKATFLEIVSYEAGTLTVRAPPNANVSQPGPHMVFVNGAHPDGAVPSVAAWVSLGLSAVAS